MSKLKIIVIFIIIVIVGLGIYLFLASKKASLPAKKEKKEIFKKEREVIPKKERPGFKMIDGVEYKIASESRVETKKGVIYEYDVITKKMDEKEMKNFAKNLLSLLKVKYPEINTYNIYLYSDENLIGEKPDVGIVRWVSGEITIRKP